MHIDQRQVKRAYMPHSEALRQLVYSKYKDVPFTNVYHTTISKLPAGHPDRLTYERHLRNLQGKAVAQIADLGTYGLLAGGALAAYHGVPKLLAAKKELDDKSKVDEGVEGGILKGSQYKSAETLEIREQPGGRSVLDHVVGKGIEAVNAVNNSAARVSADKLWGNLPTSSMDAPGPFGLPPGSMIPLALGAVPLGVAGGLSLTHKLLEATRAKMIERKKRETQRKFHRAMTGKSASALFLDRAAGEWEKSALNLGSKLTGGSLATLLALAGVGGVGGYQLASMYSSGAAKKQLLEAALKAKRKDTPITLRIDPASAEAAMYASPEPVSKLDRAFYTMPMVVPKKKKKREMFSESDVGLDMPKLAAYLVYGRSGQDFFKSANGTDVAPEVAGPNAANPPAAVDSLLGYVGNMAKGIKYEAKITRAVQIYNILKKAPPETISVVRDWLTNMSPEDMKNIPANIEMYKQHGESMKKLMPVWQRLSPDEREQALGLTPEDFQGALKFKSFIAPFRQAWGGFKEMAKPLWEGIKTNLPNIIPTLMNGLAGSAQPRASEPTPVQAAAPAAEPTPTMPSASVQISQFNPLPVADTSRSMTAQPTNVGIPGGHQVNLNPLQTPMPIK